MIDWQTITIRLVLAAVLGGIIGLERERKNWSAGMRTHMMVCVGSALIIIVSAFGFSDVLGTKNVTLDPSRIAAQVVSGIGFLGAGTIMFLRSGFIRGLTTASGLWTVAAIGLAVGSGLYYAAIVATVIAFIILLILQPLEKKFAKRFKQKYIKISLAANANPSEVTQQFISEIDKQVSNFSFEKTESGYLIEIQFLEFDINNMLPFIMRMEQQEGILEIDWG